jgi:hypothetical protein
VLRTSGDVDVWNTGLREALAQRIGELTDQRFTLGALLRHLLRERFVFFYFEMFKRQIFELPPEARHTKPVRERSV